MDSKKTAIDSLAAMETVMDKVQEPDEAWYI